MCEQGLSFWPPWSCPTWTCFWRYLTCSGPTILCVLLEISRNLSSASTPHTYLTWSQQLEQLCDSQLNPPMKSFILRLFFFHLRCQIYWCYWFSPPAEPLHSFRSTLLNDKSLSTDDLTCAERRGPFFWACPTASWSSVWTPSSTCSKSWGPCIRADRPSSERTNSLQWVSISAMLAKQPRITLRQ